MKIICKIFLFCAIILPTLQAQSTSSHLFGGSSNVATKSQSTDIDVLSTEEKMDYQLHRFNVESIELCRRASLASWNAVTDVGNPEKEQAKENAILEYAEYIKKFWNEVWRDANIEDFKNETVRRQLFFAKKLGEAVLSSTELASLTSTITQMTSIYNQATVCSFQNQHCNITTDGLTLDPEINERFAKSRDANELEYLWSQWHEKTGKLMRSKFKEYVNLINKVAEGNGFTDGGKYWQAEFEDPDFVQNVDNLWLQVEPLYDELHKYMRYKLIEIYGDKINSADSNIPAHLLGNMWAQTWENLYDDTKPFKNASLVDVTTKMKELKFTPYKMFETSNEFYTSLGFPTNQMSYTGESIIEKPKDRTIQCHASAWDLCDGKDFRIKMCTNINQEDLFVIHHEMGHIQYYIQYKHLPLILRKGANSGFHEAVGDTMALSVSNPHHLVMLGLLDNYNDTVENNINALYSEALKRIAFLPFGLLVDKWRWDVFSKNVNETQWNQHWWDLRKKYQKVTPPINRSENDFDPGSKFHVPASSKYISYFVSHILEFQFYKALCIEAGQYDPKTVNKPLHKCDFYRSKEAGQKMADGLKLGASKHWSEALKVITNETRMSANPLMEYFKPLHDYLILENQRLHKEDILRNTLHEYNQIASKQCHELTLAEWNKVTDVNNSTKREAYAKAVTENANFIKQQYKLHFEGLKPDDFTDEKIQRQILYLTQLGTNVLNDSQLNALTNAKSEMEKIYNNAKFCDYLKPNCNESELLTLDSEITEIMSKSQDFEQLKYTWTMWHNETGPLMKPYYKQYVKLSNDAAKLNGFADYGEMWRSTYEDPHFVENIKHIWKQVEPLYEQLHEYTRYKLIEIYGEKMNASDPLIPAHLLGNMWAQSWVSLYERIKPFKNSSDIDISTSLQRNNFTPLKIFQEADRFYKSLGLESNEMSYTEPSIIEKPKDRVIVCHASAWDFCDGRDFRIKQCTSVDQRNFVTAHHEMGHIQYFILYEGQPIALRAGANPGFHEAVGDLIALSVSTPTHFKKMNLLQNYRDTEEDNINALLKMALERVAFLPFGLLIDLYRYDIFSGKVSDCSWNQHWETLREQYQKIRSPVERFNEHFDAGAKFHVPSDGQYVAYFVAHILEFQLHKSLCLTAKQYDPNNASKPLHKCDIEGSLEAGKRLRAGLSLGLSKHWSEALSAMTDGEREISADGLLEYFKPLHEFLIIENEKMKSEAMHSKQPYVIGGFITIVVVVALISFGIYYFNKK